MFYPFIRAGEFDCFYFGDTMSDVAVNVWVHVLGGHMFSFLMGMYIEWNFGALKPSSVCLSEPCSLLFQQSLKMAFPPSI